MNKLRFILFFSILTTTLISSEKYVIGNWRGGFFSNFFCVINHLIWSEKNNKTPVVYWGKNNLYYDSKRGDNAWEYYFNPVSPLKYQKGDKMSTNYWAPDHSGISCYQYWLFPGITKNYREYINKIIKKYISFKPEVSEKITKFYELYMSGKKTIGIHVRGPHFETPPVKISRFIEVANACDGDQFLIATDEEKNVEILEKNLNKKVIYYDAHRSTDNTNYIYLQPSSHLKEVSKAELGEEVLIEAFLLSLCDTFVHSCSNVSLVALFFNPSLKNIYLDPRDNKTQMKL